MPVCFCAGGHYRSGMTLSIHWWIGEMIVRDRGTIAFFATSFSLVTFATVVAAMIIAREGFGTNGAAWVQAGGSIAAIAGAVWLFRSETGRRRRERRAMGEEVAWAVRFALTNAQHEARTIAVELVDEHLLEKGNPESHWLLRSENCQNVLRVFSQRTDHIHPALNHVASNGLLLLRQMDKDIRRAVDFVIRGERPSIEIATAIAWYEGHFEQLLQELDARMRGVLKALDENEDVFPLRSLEAWKAPKDQRNTNAP
jgi:hypothetical protein